MEGNLSLGLLVHSIISTQRLERVYDSPTKRTNESWAGCRKHPAIPFMKPGSVANGVVLTIAHGIAGPDCSKVPGDIHARQDQGRALAGSRSPADSGDVVSIVRRPNDPARHVCRAVTLAHRVYS